MQLLRQHVSGYWRRHFAALFRWLHIQLSMVSFAILFFFAVTGLTLNHADWFETGTPRTTLSEGRMETEWMTTPEGVAKLEIVERLRSAHGISGALNELTVDGGQCFVSFRGPGYAADASIDRGTGVYEISETRMGLVAILNDLHKGRDTGRAWAWIIDLSAALMVLVSLTGMVLICFLKRRRFMGLTTALAGGLVCFLIYLIFVP